MKVIPEHRLTAAERNAMPASMFGDPKNRKFPMPDKAHIRNAEARKRFASSKVKAKINKKAHKAHIGNHTEEENPLAGGRPIRPNLLPRDKRVDDRVSHLKDMRFRMQTPEGWHRGVKGNLPKQPSWTSNYKAGRTPDASDYERAQKNVAWIDRHRKKSPQELAKKVLDVRDPNRERKLIAAPGGVFQASMGESELTEAKAKLGSGSRFKSLKKKLSGKHAKHPGALAAWIGRKKFGKARFGQLAARGKRTYTESKDNAVAKLFALSESLIGLKKSVIG